MRGASVKGKPRVTLRNVPSAAEAALASVWSALESRLQVTFASGVRRDVEDLYVHYGDADSYDLSDDSAALQEAFIAFAKRELLRQAKHRRPRPKPRVKVPKRGGKPPRREREQEKNARLLAFGAERIVSFFRLVKGQLTPGRLGREGVPWEKLHVEWLRAYPAPADWIPSWPTLRTEYYAAARNSHLADDFLTQFKEEFHGEWEEHQRALESLRQWYAGLTEEERAERFDSPIEISEEDWKPVREAQQKLREIREKDRACFSSEEAYQEWRAKCDAEHREEFRASLTRQDLIEVRVRQLVWRVPDKDPEKEKLLWQNPLRDWFLVEARGGRGSFWGPWGRHLVARRKEIGVTDARA